MRQDARGAGHVLYHQGLTESSRDTITQEPRHHVRRGAGSGGDNQLYGPTRPRLGIGPRYEQDETTTEQHAQKRFHGSPSQLIFILFRSGRSSVLLPTL